MCLVDTFLRGYASTVECHHRFQNGVNELSQQVRAQALPICTVALTILSVVLIALVSCALLPLAAISGAVVALMLAGVMLFLAVRSVIKRPKMPEGFLNVVKKVYPPVVHKLCSAQTLTIQQFRELLSGIEQQNFANVSAPLAKKLASFGAERVLTGCEGIELPPLDEVLTEHCPCYFMKTFIDLGGATELTKAEGVSPAIYWLGHPALTDKFIVLDEYGYLFANSVTREEYEKLAHHAKNDTWDQVQGLYDEVRLRMRAMLDGLNVPGLNKPDIIASINTDGTHSVALCKHGMSWEQLLLLKNVDIMNVNYLFAFESLSRLGCNLIRVMEALCPFLDESSSDYDPYIALITWEEWKAGVESLYNRCDADAAQALMKLLSRRSCSHKDLKPLTYRYIDRTCPVYRLDVSTGARVECLRSVSKKAES
ncbi:DUF1389 domain-containing protein [Chlamydia vaughanii]|uniref:DUF1389 domain-containing protein n=1 Tax=Chlamydia vaughanii TaxID=3112552 RepID=UPI0032B18DE1